MKPCEHKDADGMKCGKPATVVIKAKQGRVQYPESSDASMGRGVASLWIPVCDVHKNNYPDYDGFALEESDVQTR